MRINMISHIITFVIDRGITFVSYDKWRLLLASSRHCWVSELANAVI